MTREVGVGSAYTGLQRAGERGNISVCLCYSEIGKECLSGVVYQSVCVLVRVCMTLQTPCGKTYVILERNLAMKGPSFGSHCVKAQWRSLDPYTATAR